MQETENNDSEQYNQYFTQEGEREREKGRGVGRGEEESGRRVGERDRRR